MKYRVEHAHWVNGSGWSYNETIDNTNDNMTERDLGEWYGEYCENEGDEIRLIENDTNKVVVVYER